MITKNQIKLIRQLEQKKFRRREGLFVAEGPKVVDDLIRYWQPKAIFATDSYSPAPSIPSNSATPSNPSIPSNPSNSSVPSNPSNSSVPSSVIQRISEDELSRISFLQHPQQVLALFPIPEQPSPHAVGERLKSTPNHLILALDGVQDPGNLGTIIRLADWFGIDTIVCSEDTADAWNPKVVQATMGSIARVKLTYTCLPEFLDTLPADIPVFGTLLDGENIYEQELSEGGIIIMGNEGNGLTEKVRRRVNRRLLIPSYRNDTAESLNVAIATAIICAEFRRRGSVCL